MKLWILLPCVMVGNAFAGAYVGQPMGQPLSNTLGQAAQTESMITSGSTGDRDAQYPFGHFHVAMSYLAFAAIIKYQFPGHNDMDDLSLATRAVQSYPVYAQYVTFPTK